MPSIGFSARLAIPVLNEREVTSKIAVPVVSDPVPAVVGTGLVLAKSRVTATECVSTSDEWLNCLVNGLTFANWGVYEIHQVRIFVYTEPEQGVIRESPVRNFGKPYKLAALAVSMTLPPPTLWRNA